MTNRLATMLFLGVLALLFIPSQAHASCNDYWDVATVTCTSGGCQSEHELIACTFGCISGQCVHQGGSGLCCNKIYYVPVIYPDGGDCTGECGALRAYPPSPSSTTHHSAQLRGGYTPGLIMLSNTLSIKPPTLVFIPDRCSHTFGVVQQAPTFVNRGL